MSLFSDVALPLVVAATTEATVVAVVTSPLEFVFATRFVVGDEYREESEQVVFEVVELCDTVELMDSSSCRFFSYSVCFPCCISSFVKLAASSPKIFVYKIDVLHLHSPKKKKRMVVYNNFMTNLPSS